MFFTHHGMNSISRAAPTHEAVISLVGASSSYRNSSNYYAPLCTYGRNSISEVLYLASEIGTSGTITAIEYNVNYISSGSNITRNISIYMRNVTDTTLSTTSLRMNSSEKVFANMNFRFDKNTYNENNPDTWTWNKITLDTPFAYDSSKNLMIMFVDSGLTNIIDTAFTAYKLSTGTAPVYCYKYNTTSSDAYYPESKTYSMSPSTTSKGRPCIRFTMQVPDQA